MSASHFTALPHGLDSPKLASSRPAISAAPRQFDQHFWQDVFEQAKGIGVSEAKLTPAGGNSESAPEPRKHTAGVMGPDQSHQSSLSVAGQQGMHVTGMALSVMHGGERGDAKAAPTLGSQACRPMLTDGLVAVSDDASLDAESLVHARLAERQRASAVANDPQDEVAIRAHAVQTAEGDWKLTLRAHRSLSVTQALAAVAQATQYGSAGGQIRQVVLNGASIYQSADPSEAVDSASSSFEFRC